MRAREEAVAEIKARMDSVTEEARGYYYKLGSICLSSPDPMPVGKSVLDNLISVRSESEKASCALKNAEAFLADSKSKADELESLRDRISEKNKEIKLSRLRLGAIVYEQCSLGLLDKSDFASVYSDAEDAGLIAERNSSDGFLDRFLPFRKGRIRNQKSRDARLLGYASLVLSNNLGESLSGDNASSLYRQCIDSDSELRDLSVRRDELSEEIRERDAERRSLERGGLDKLRTDAEVKSRNLREEIIGYGIYLFDRGASWISETTPAEVLDCLDSILKGQSEYSSLASTLSRLEKQAKADDYKIQIENEKAKILILQKEKERIDLQISQIQAEIDRLEGTIGRLSME